MLIYGNIQTKQPNPFNAMTITAKTAVATVTELKTQWHKVAARSRRRPVQITHNGKPAGALLSQAAYEDWLVSQMEEEVISDEDLAIINARAAESDADSIPWEQVKAEMKRDGLL